MILNFLFIEFLYTNVHKIVLGNYLAFKNEILFNL
jgi:hypothetical protein